jgi:cell division protein FtsW
VNAPVAAGRAPPIDGTLVGLWLAVSAIGVVMVGSASMEMAAAGGGSPFGRVFVHVFYLGLAAACLVGTLALPLSALRRLAPAGAAAALGLLALVLVPGIGREVNGASRWFNTPFVTVQPSELAKPLYLLLLARSLVHVGGRIVEPRVLLAVAAPYAALAVLLVLEPDFGTTVVLGATTLVLLFLAGARVWHLSLAAIAACVLLAAVAQVYPHVMARLLNFLDPWAVPFGEGYQLVQALIAIGRGGIGGVGIGDSVQKLFYLPEAHNDFIMAVIAEEAGMAGASCVLALLLWLSLHVVWIGRRAEAAGLAYGAMLAYGAGALIGIQSLVNVFVNVGLLPTKGLTLPFVSYGGNSLLACAVLLGLALRVDHETRLAGTPRRPRGRA